RRVPTVFVTGRNDGILPPNFTSRAYFGLNNVIDGSHSPLHYYEVTNAHHLDSFNQFPGYNAMFIPLHRYFLQAMDLMYEHLRHGGALPPSQVVHTVPRGVGAPPLAAANVPPIADSPATVALITYSGGQVIIRNGRRGGGRLRASGPERQAEEAEPEQQADQHREQPDPQDGAEPRQRRERADQCEWRHDGEEDRPRDHALPSRRCVGHC